MSSKSNKAIVGFIKLQIPAGKANPAPPIGPALGQKGLNIMEFCKSFNDRTKSFEVGMPVRASITAYSDRTFNFELKGSPVSYLIRKVLGIEKGSNAPGRTMIGKITHEQLKIVAQQKMGQGLSARDLDNAVRIVAGSARSMGLRVEAAGAQNG
jgi:large subunit ribosomal protein L11